MAAVCQQNCTKQPDGTDESDPITFWMDSPKWERIVRNVALAVRPSLVLTLLEKEVWITLQTIVGNIKPLIQKVKLNIILTLYIHFYLLSLNRNVLLKEKEYISAFQGVSQWSCEFFCRLQINWNLSGVGWCWYIYQKHQGLKIVVCKLVHGMFSYGMNTLKCKRTKHLHLCIRLSWHHILRYTFLTACTLISWPTSA